MRVSSKVDYAVRAVAELAVRSPSRADGPTKADVLVESQSIPPAYLESILAGLRRSGVVGSRRGADGGYWLARAPEEITVADVIRAVEGPLADVRGEAPEDLDYVGPAAPLEDVWLATRAALRRVLEGVTMQHLADGRLPSDVVALLDDPDARSRR